MKNFLKKLPLLLSFSVAAFFAACSNSSSAIPYWLYEKPAAAPSTPSEPSTPSSPSQPSKPAGDAKYFTQAALAHRAYIGGSLIYNPDKSNLSRLNSGSKIAVRTSKLVVKKVSMKQVATDSGSDFRKDGGEVYVDENGNITSGTSGGEETIDYVEEAEGSAVYGYIQITGVSKTSISFTYNYYANATAPLSSQSVTLALGSSSKLGAGESEVKFEAPQIARRGFENAAWLTFVNDESKKTSCMYSCVTELDTEKKSLYGVNSDCDFIYIVGKASDNDGNFNTAMPTYAADMVSYGDYIVDQETGEMYSVAGDPSSNLSSVLKKENDYSGNANGGVEDFMDFSYAKWQFPDSENGPQKMFDAFPKKVKDSIDAIFELGGAGLPDSDRAILKLNWALCDADTLKGIAEDFRSKGDEAGAKALEDAVKDLHTDQVAAWKNKLLNERATISDFEKANEKYVETMRFILDDLYNESPDAYVDPPSMFNVYPDVSVELGDDGNQSFSFDETNLISSSLDLSVFKSVENAKKYEDYVKKRDEIVNKFKSFHHIDLAKVNGTKVSDLGLSVSLGVKGSVKKNLSVTSGEFGVKGLGAALFVKAEASLQATKTGDVSFLDDETREKLNKDLHEPIQFNIGPIPFVYKTKIAFDVGWNAKVTSNIKYMAGMTAMYGGEIDLGAQWGVKFKYKVVPVGGYFNTWPTNKKSYDDSVFYVGPADTASDAAVGLDVGVYVRGTLNPSLGIGFKYISAGMETPFIVQPEAHYIIDTIRHLKGLLTLKYTVGPFFEVTIPIIGKKFKTNWTAFTLLDCSNKELFDIPLD